MQNSDIGISRYHHNDEEDQGRSLGAQTCSILALLGDRCLGWGFDGHRHFGTLFEFHFVAVFVGQRVFDPDLSIEVVSPFRL